MSNVTDIRDGVRLGKQFVADVQARIAGAETLEQLDGVADVLRAAPSSVSIWSLARLDADLARRQRALLPPPSDGGHAA